MIQYFLHDGDNQTGPFIKSELIAQGITQGTYVWSELLEGWTIASQVDDLKDLFEKVPPPFNGVRDIKQPPLFKHVDKSTFKEKQDVPFYKTLFNHKNRKKSIVLIGLILIASVVAFIVYQSNLNEEKIHAVQAEAAQIEQNAAQKVEEAKQKELALDSQKQNEQLKTPQELKQELITKEQQTPLKYLSVSGTMVENKILTRAPSFFNHSEYRTDGYLINGAVINSASIAVFKDIVITLSFYAPTKSLIKQTDFTIYKYAAPRSVTRFVEKVYAPQGVGSWNITVKGAAGY